MHHAHDNLLNGFHGKPHACTLLASFERDIRGRLLKTHRRTWATAVVAVRASQPDIPLIAYLNTHAFSKEWRETVHRLIWFLRPWLITFLRLNVRKPYKNQLCSPDPHNIASHQLMHQRLTFYKAHESYILLPALVGTPTC